MAEYPGKEPDLERGESLGSTGTEEPPSPTPAAVPVTEENISDATGQTGSARRKQGTREWQFFPACERQLSMCLDYLAANLWTIFKDIERLERQNREDGRYDYREHKPDNEFGEQKGKLMEKMIVDLERYLRIFSNAIIVMNQSAPNVRSVNDCRWWAHYNIAPNPSDHAFCASNYRVLGPRPSVIDTLMHSAFQVVAERYYKHIATPADTAAGDIIIFNWSYTTLSIIAHMVIISVALTFLLLPLTLVYLLDLSKGLAVLLIVLFCLCFCILFFIFGRLNTDHKFILLFAYTGVMATLLSNLGTGCHPGD